MDTPTEETKRRRGGSKPILKVSGIGRVENNLKPTLFSSVHLINQKNYYTDYLKRDNQIMALRDAEERHAREKAEKTQDKDDKDDKDEKDEKDEDDEILDEEEKDAYSDTVIIHPGSRNLRIGLGSQAYPKSIPFCIAHRQPADSGDNEDIDMSDANESKDDSLAYEAPWFEDAYTTVYKDFRERMKFYKRRILPNSHDAVVGFNGRSVPEEISDYNDLDRTEWTEINEKSPAHLVGDEAFRIPYNSKPSYKLKWPIQNGLFNESDYSSQQELLGDIESILTDSLKKLNVKPNGISGFSEFKTVLVIPDLYDKQYVHKWIDLLFKMGFKNICIIQESMAATFGAGISTACVVDVGAQKISVTCVEEGMCITDSRVNLKYGGDDMTKAFYKLLKRSGFPYQEFDITRNHDWALAEELKKNFCTTNDAEIAVQLYSFFQRSPERTVTHKYQFKTFEEVMLAPLGLFYPQLFGQISTKLKDRYRLIPRSLDIYSKEDKSDDPISDAQINVQKDTLSVWGLSYTNSDEPVDTKAKGAAGTPSSPGTPAIGATGAAGTGGGETAQARAAAHNAVVQSQLHYQQKVADSLDARVAAATALDHAIIESITQAGAKSTSSKQQDFYENLLIVGGGAKFLGFDNLLIDHLAMWRQTAAQNSGTATPDGDILIMAPPREMDPELISWKGGSVFAKLKIVSDCWITQKEWDYQGHRVLQYKALFSY